MSRGPTFAELVADECLCPWFVHPSPMFCSECGKRVPSHERWVKRYCKASFDAAPASGREVTSSVERNRPGSAPARPAQATGPSVAETVVDAAGRVDEPHLEPATSPPATLPRHAGGLVTKRRTRTYRARVVEFVKPGRRRLSTFLQALAADTERVYLVGLPGGGAADKVRQFALSPLPAGWAYGAGHYLADMADPVLRFRRPDGRPVDVYNAATWFGDGVEPSACKTAYEALEVELRGVFGVGVLATPATTGRECFVQSIAVPEGWAVLDDDTQTLIRSTSPQGRIETCPVVPELNRLVELDGRLMYGALCRELGAGPVAVHDESDEYVPYAPGRYRVVATVPADWSHVGVLPVKQADGRGWWYPSDRGARFETWADSAEVHLALKHGWQIEVRERVLLAAGKARPLDLWARKLLTIADTDDPLVRAGARAVMLHTIGSFAGRPHVLTRSTSNADDIPTGVRDVQAAGGVYVWQETSPPAWPEMSHPEWAARIWARARCRLLDGPGDTGALHVPRTSVVAFLTDAIYLDHDPEWADDGAAGRFRIKTNKAGPMPAPTNLTALVRLKGANQ